MYLVECEDLSGDGKVTFLLDKVVGFCKHDDDCTDIWVMSGCAESEVITVKESYERVYDMIKSACDTIYGTLEEV
jgi:hypothetical protein